VSFLVESYSLLILSESLILSLSELLSLMFSNCSLALSKSLFTILVCDLWNVFLTDFLLLFFTSIILLLLKQFTGNEFCANLQFVFNDSLFSSEETLLDYSCLGFLLLLE